MKVKESHIRTVKNARYFTNEPVSLEIKDFWVVIHGYAQLASDFINEFDFLDNEKTLIAAPEGLSKFYSGSRIGASWMTKEDRKTEIEDYLEYLNVFVRNLKNTYDLSAASFNLLGFSQGVHTAVRFFINSDTGFGKLFLCSSDFPKDVDLSKIKDRLTNAGLYLIYGLKDGIISQSVYDESELLLQENKIKFIKTEFDGGHRISKESIIKSFVK
ncbi:MAG: hypothetical protein JST15_08630 [Bacteroidetes bacterium]|nr:hypothetical protein [Bacteroidota bacterium]